MLVPVRVTPAQVALSLLCTRLNTLPAVILSSVVPLMAVLSSVTAVPEPAMVTTSVPACCMATLVAPLTLTVSVLTAALPSALVTLRLFTIVVTPSTLTASRKIVPSEPPVMSARVPPVTVNTSSVTVVPLLDISRDVTAPEPPCATLKLDAASTRTVALAVTTTASSVRVVPLVVIASTSAPPFFSVTEALPSKLVVAVDEVIAPPVTVKPSSKVTVFANEVVPKNEIPVDDVNLIPVASSSENPLLSMRMAFVTAHDSATAFAPVFCGVYVHVPPLVHVFAVLIASHVALTVA